MKRDRILQVVQLMPDDISLTELFRRLRVLEEIECGELSLAAEGSIPHEEVHRRFSRPMAGGSGA